MAGIVQVRVFLSLQGDSGCYRDAAGVWRGYGVCVDCEVRGRAEVVCPERLSFAVGVWVYVCLC